MIKSEHRVKISDSLSMAGEGMSRKKTQPMVVSAAAWYEPRAHIKNQPYKTFQVHKMVQLQ